jgi:hypothetical protein
METISIKDWVKYREGSDEESNFYLLMAYIRDVAKISEVDKNKALGILRDMIFDLENEHLTYFVDPNKLRHILMGKHVVCLTYLSLKHKNKCVPIELLVERQIWKKIKIESPTAV